MTLIIDFLLLAASGSAGFYCWVLNKRLTALTNTEDGFQSGIAALSQSAEDMQNAMSDTKNAANNTAAELKGLLSQADQKIPELQDLIQKITDISTQTVDDTEAATKSLVETMSPHIESARQVATLLLNSLEKASGAALPEPPVEDSKKDAGESAEGASADAHEFEIVASEEDEETAIDGEAA